MDETQAIALLKQGDLSGLEVLVHCYQVKAVYSAYLIVHDQHLAEDIVQAAFLRAIDKIAQFDDRRSFGPWFMRSVVNAAIDTAKQQARWLPLEPEAEGETPVPIAWLKSDISWIEDLVETKETRSLVRKALNQLAPEQRAAIVLRYFLEMSEADMVASLHQPSSTVKWWLHEARKRLKKRLQPIWNTRFDESYEDLRDE
jgi:RNA polymerase sigma-70 factor (ECF subfamily)